MKYVKSFIAKRAEGFFIFTVFMLLLLMGFLAVLITQWDVPLVFWEVIFLSIWFCWGCLTAFIVAAMAARQFTRAAKLGFWWCVFAVAFWQVWYQDARLRPWMLVLLPVFLYLGAVLVRDEKFPKREAIQKVIVISSIIMGLFAALYDVGLLWPGVNTHNTPVGTSPDGRYQAMILYGGNDVDLGGYEPGFCFVTIKSNYFSVFNILDYPNRKLIGTVDGEFLKSVDWANQHTLLVGYYSDTVFVQQEKSWRDVKIIYKNVGKPTKLE